MEKVKALSLYIRIMICLRMFSTLISRLCSLFEGGTFALYSLLCRYAKLSILPNHQEMDEKLSTYATGSPGETRQSAAVKSFFEKHPKSQKCLLLFVLLGTCMAIGDSVLTPTISGKFSRELLCSEP
jgi:K+ transporter